ncbi:NADP-dependent oxidoreductase [Rhodococcus qingshengii]|uniref:NADP-dependent oxidoreductase n=1 Tax=Rhodococcus qingshengii TaxID=334542 RepID=UPI003661B4E1
MIESSLYRLLSRPNGIPTERNFETVTQILQLDTPETLLVRNRFLSVDPYHRELMNDGFDLRQPLEGRSIGEVLESTAASIAPGTLVFHRQGWRTHALVPAAEVRILPRYDEVPTSAFLSILGGTGLTAYVALTRIARLQPGESVFVSSAAGGVGTAATQLARVLGARQVIGSAGSRRKLDALVRSGAIDAGIDYRTQNLTDELRGHFPKGYEIYVDNVGSTHLEAVISTISDGGRIAWVGAIAQYNDTTPPPAPRNLFDIVGKSIRLEGFLVRDYRHLQREYEYFVVPHLRSGVVGPVETIADGFDSTLDAFLSMLSGENIGKQLVDLGEPTCPIRFIASTTCLNRAVALSIPCSRVCSC